MKTRSLAVLLALLSSVAGCSANADGEDTEQGAAAATRSSEYDRWAKVVTDADAPLHRNGRATVVGVRGLGADGSRNSTQSRRAYDDLLVVLKADGTAVRFSGSTHPFEKKGEGSIPDVDNDGARDVGMIRTGYYEAVGRGAGRLIAGQAAFDVRVAKNSARFLPGFRDTNHDGVFDEAERAASVARGDKLSAVLFHSADGNAPAAVGCQVLSDSSMRDFVRAVGGASATFDYVLVDAADVE